MMEAYKTIQGTAQARIEEKKSEFIAHAAFADTEEKALAFLNGIRAKHRTANHNVYAYILRDGARMRYSDDGEPAKTSGLPTLEAIRHAGLVDCIVVTTRYFGGTLLGTGGLVRAYTQSAKDALDAAGISVVRRWIEVLLPCSYAQYERVKLETEGFGGVIAEADYGADIALTVLLPEERADAFLAHILDVTAGTVEGMVCGERFQDVPWRPPVRGEGGPHG